MSFHRSCCCGTIGDCEACQSPDCSPGDFVPQAMTVRFTGVQLPNHRSYQGINTINNITFVCTRCTNPPAGHEAEMNCMFFCKTGIGLLGSHNPSTAGCGQHAWDNDLLNCGGGPWPHGDTCNYSWSYFHTAEIIIVVGPNGLVAYAVESGDPCFDTRGCFTAEFFNFNSRYWMSSQQPRCYHPLPPPPANCGSQAGNGNCDYRGCVYSPPYPVGFNPCAEWTPSAPNGQLPIVRPVFVLGTVLAAPGNLYGGSGSTLAAGLSSPQGAWPYVCSPVCRPGTLNQRNYSGSNIYTSGGFPLNGVTTTVSKRYTYSFWPAGVNGTCLVKAIL